MRSLALAYGVAVYAYFLATFVYLIAFLGADAVGLSFIEKTIDRGAPVAAFAPPALQNLALMLLFGVSHSVMARPGFKSAWTRIVPKSMERSTYVLVSSLALVALYAFWIPMPQSVWRAEGVLAATLTVVFFLGWALLLASTFLINHFDLFGLRQAWHAFKGTKKPSDPFRTPLFYNATRHPLYLGFVTAFWSASTMTAGHLLFSAIMTIYILIAIGYEERDLLAHFGEEYRRYMARVPMLLPIGRRKE